MKKFLTVRIANIALLVSAVAFTSCRLTQLPGFKQEAKRQEERITRETNEAIQKSPALQKLNHLCTEQIPLPDGFVLVNKSRDFNEERFLSYGYRASNDYESVKHFYIGHFTQNGWEVAGQKNGGWGPSNVRFRNGEYQVTIYNMRATDGINYALVCAKL
jgi:hypothetical protein